MVQIYFGSFSMIGVTSHCLYKRSIVIIRGINFRSYLIICLSREYLFEVIICFIEGLLQMPAAACKFSFLCRIAVRFFFTVVDVVDFFVLCCCCQLFVVDLPFGCLCH